MAMSGNGPNNANQLPTIHIADSDGEIRAHGLHADLIGDTSFGSHQERWGPDGRPIDGRLNFQGGGFMGLDAAGLPIIEHQG
jgi:hypothetical protein